MESFIDKQTIVSALLYLLQWNIGALTKISLNKIINKLNVFRISITNMDDKLFGDLLAMEIKLNEQHGLIVI